MEPYKESFEIAKPRRPWLRRLKRLGWGLLALLIVAACVQTWRHYSAQKRLDETLTEMDRADPGWRLEDIEAAREQVPEEENSARVVVAAAKLLPKNWPVPEFDDLFAHLTPEKQLVPDEFARLKVELDNLRPALQEACKLAGMPRGRHHIAYQPLVYETMLLDQSESRRVMRLLILDAMRHDQEGDMNRALTSCRAALNAARSLGDEPNALSQLIRIVGIMKTCQALERVLAQGEPSSDDLASMQHTLRNEDAFPDLLIAARGERAALHATFDALESGAVPLSKLEGVRPNWKDSVFGWFGRDKFREAHPGMLASMTRFIEITQFPMHLQAKVERQLDLKLRALKKFDPLAVLFIPAINKLNDVSRRKHAYLRCMTVALAAERYRREKMAWPETIDKLCPKYIPDVALDPFVGEPLRYRRLEDGAMIYSVCSDGADNGGNFDREHPNQPGVDIGYRLWDVAKRRQAPRPKVPEVNPER